MSEQQLIDNLIETLRELPEVEAEYCYKDLISKHNDRRYDAQISLHLAGKHFVLLVEVKKAIFPRDVRQLIWQFREGSQKNPTRQEETQLSFLVAESISPGAKEILKKERVGYYDSGGSLYLAAKEVYLFIEKPPPKTLERTIRTLFSGRRAQVIHTLLVMHHKWFGVVEMAKIAMVSPATVSQVLTELDRFDWLEVHGQGPAKERRLHEPAALLDAWVKQLSISRPQVLRRYYVPSMKADLLEERISQMFDSHQVQYAVTHEAAAQHYAPFLSNISQIRMRVRIGKNYDDAIGDLNARVVNEGANLCIIETKSLGELMFRERFNELWLASPIQIYLDLLRGEGRSKEMAEHFRMERIGF